MIFVSKSIPYRSTQIGIQSVLDVRTREFQELITKEETGKSETRGPPQQLFGSRDFDKINNIANNKGDFSNEQEKNKDSLRRNREGDRREPSFGSERNARDGNQNGNGTRVQQGDSGRNVRAYDSE